jgi:multiple sugar transport system substrate-binding protein
MWYRKDLFENPEEQAAFQEKYGYELQPPETWDQWLDIAEFFTRKKGENLAGEVLEEDFYGCATYGQRDFMYAWWFNRYASMGGSYFDENLNPMINTPEAIQALENWVASLQYSPPEVLTYGFDELQAAFISGRCAMEINWTDVGRVGSNPTVSQVVGKIGVGLVPGFQLPDGNILHRPVLAAGRVMSITKTCKAPELAFEILRLMALDASLAYVSSSYAGMDPFRISHFETPEAFGMFSSYEEAKEYLDGVRLNIELGYPELTMQGSAQYMDILSLALSQALAKQKTPQEALDWAASEWNKITDSLGRDIQKQYYQSLIQSWKENGYWFD